MATPMSLQSESPRSVTTALSAREEDGEKMGTVETKGRRRDLAMRTMEAWAWGSALECTTAPPPREAIATAMAASQTVSMWEAMQGMERGTRRESRVERSTGEAVPEPSRIFHGNHICCS